MRKITVGAGIILLLACLFGFSGCHSEEADMSQKAVQQFLALYQARDSSAGSYIADRMDEEMEFNGFQAVLADRLSFEIQKSKKEDENYIVSVLIHNVDFQAAFEELSQEINVSSVTESEILEQLKAKLQSESAKMKEFEVEVPVRKDGEEYKLILTSELSNALFGGYNEYLTSLTGGMMDVE